LEAAKIRRNDLPVVEVGLKPVLASIIVVALAPVWGHVHAEKSNKRTWPGNTWTVASSPEAAGWSGEKLTAAKAYGESIHTSAVMIVRGGEVVYQWGDCGKKITSYSIRKSLISALCGIYSSEGAIDVNETLEQLGR
jgi:hypothetical protein